MINFKECKVCSNESLLKVLNTVTREVLGQIIIRHIEEDGLNFYERDFMENIVDRISEIDEL